MNRLFFFALLFSSTIYAQQGTESFEKALAYFQKKDFNAAEIEVKNSIQKNSKYLPARLLLSDILLNKGKFDSAEKELTIALELYADHQTVIVPLAKVKGLLGKHKEALDLLEQSPHLSKIADYFLVQGESHKSLAQFVEAEQSYLNYIQAHGENKNVHTKLADLYFIQAKQDLVSNYLDRALLKDPSYIPALMLKAEQLKNKKQFDEALVIYSLIIETKSDNQQALFGKAHVLLEQHKLAQALELTVLLRKNHPNDPYAKLLHASIVTLQGDRKKSRQILREIQQQILGLGNKRQKEKEILLLSASVDLFNENYNQARRQFVEYISLYGENSVARRHLATIELKQNNLQSARTHVNKALAANKNNAELFLLAAHIYSRLGLIDEHFSIVEQAYKVFEENDLVRDQYIGALIASNQIAKAIHLLEKSTTNLVNQTLLAYLQLQTNQLEKALNTTQKLLDDEPNKLEILQLAGELSLQLGRQLDAENFFNLALKLEPEFKPALLALAGISLNNKQFSEAEKFYQEILSFYPNDPFVLQLYADLAIKDGRSKLAIKLLNVVNKENKHFLPVQRILLALYIETNQFSLAEKTLILLEQHFSFDQQLLLAKSKLQIKQAKNKHASRTLKILFGLAYDDVLKLEKIAMLQIDIADISAVEKSLTRINELTQQQAAPYLVARFLLVKGDLSKAENIISANLTEDGSKLAWQELQAHLFIAQGNFDKAIDSLEKLFELSNNRSHMQLLAQSYMQREQLSETKKLLSAWVQSEKMDAWAIGQLSELGARTGDIDLAINSLLQYPALDNHPIFLNNLSNHYLKRDIKTALSYAKKAYELLPNVAAINDTLGWTLVKNEQFQQGLSYLREATARDIDNASYHYHLAYSLAKLRRFELAKTAFDKAIELNGSHELRIAVGELMLQSK